MLEFRALKPEEIEVRVAQVGQSNGRGWAQLLLYKDARVDMSILDETVGPMNWQRDHYECKGNLYCKVGIAEEMVDADGVVTKAWTWKADCGAESNTEKEKGEASDSFKRACTNWGIGRELYTKIPIFVSVETISNGNGYKLKNKEYWTVGDIEIDKKNNKILYVEILDKNNNKVFNWGTKTSENLPEKSEQIKQYKRVRRGTK